MHSSHCSMYNFQFSLPLSKSVRARELVLDALNGRCVEVEDDNDDIFVLSRALNQCTMHNAQLSDQSDQLDVSDNFQLFIAKGSKTFGSTFNFLSPKAQRPSVQLSTLNLNASGTALRFLTAFCAVSEGSFLLTGSKRLCERPIKPLVDALREMGADIEYVDKEGFAPLLIEGGKLNGGRVSLDASVSSQFVSALMLIADRVEGGVEIEYEGNVASQSYIKLTESVIERYKRGVCCSEEKDWSSATVWYAAMAVLKRGKFLLEGLSLDSCQPDRAIVEVFEKLGVKTTEVENGVEIESNGVVVDKLVLDCKNMPDAVMYIAVAACLLGVDFEISGVETLRVKESDRIEALITEMRKCGYIIQCTMHNFCDKRGQSNLFGLSSGAKITTERSNAQCIMHNAQCTDLVKIETYDDHRVAMAMAVVGLVMDVEIENPEVVNKSYPGFWEEMKKIK